MKSNRKSSNQEQVAPFDLGVLLLAIIVPLGLLLSLRDTNLHLHRKLYVSKAHTELLSSALRGYWEEYHAAPGGDAGHVLNTLRGENPRKIVFFAATASSVNSRGEFVDLWGTPYHIDVSRPESPRVWSCGPNRRDEGGADGTDDIVSWR